VSADSDVVARHELADRVKTAIRHHGRLRVSPMLIEGMASAAADVIVKSDLRAPGQDYETGYQNGESNLLADVFTLCDQLDIEVGDEGSFEAIRAEVTRLRDDHGDSMLQRQLDDATAEVARLAREVQQLRDLGSIWPLRQRLEDQRRQIDELREDLERRDEQVGRAVALARAIWSPDRGLRQGMPDWLFKSSAQWPDVVKWVSDPTSVDELDQAGRPDHSQDEDRTPIAAGWGRERSTVWACPRCEQQHAITGDTWLDCACGARYQFVYHDEPENKPASEVTAGEVDGWRWWRVEDAPDDDWLAYDNRPMMDQWHDDQINATRDLEAGRPPRPVEETCPRLVQGRVPWAVVREATGS
jgi:hypothetical protein